MICSTYSTNWARKLKTSVSASPLPKPAKASQLLTKIKTHEGITLGGKLGTGHGLVRFLTL